MAVAERELQECPACGEHHVDPERPRSRHSCERYSPASIDLRVDGAMLTHYGELIEREEYQWIRARSHIETTGDVGSDLLTGLIDVERANSALKRHGRDDRERSDATASAIACFLTQAEFSEEEMESFRRCRMPIQTLQRKGTAYMAAWLSGEDPGKAWRRARRHEPATVYDTDLPERAS